MCSIIAMINTMTSIMITLEPVSNIVSYLLFDNCAVLIQLSGDKLNVRRTDGRTSNTLSPPTDVDERTVYVVSGV